jgi:hypothetical protein
MSFRNSLIGLAGALFVAGVLVIVIAGGAIGVAVGSGMIGATFVLLVALAFFLVGDSEDRDREQRPRG